MPVSCGRWPCICESLQPHAPRGRCCEMCPSARLDANKLVCCEVWRAGTSLRTPQPAIVLLLQPWHLLPILLHVGMQLVSLRPLPGKVFLSLLHCPGAPSQHAARFCVPIVPYCMLHETMRTMRAWSKQVNMQLATGMQLACVAQVPAWHAPCFCAPIVSQSSLDGHANSAHRTSS